MSLRCSSVPNYDTRSCCQECHDGKESEDLAVLVKRKFIPVCHGAFRYAKKNRYVTSKGSSSFKGGKIGEKRPSVRLNHA